MSKHQAYESHIRWTGNRSAGTATYRGYDRTWDIRSPGKPIVHCSNDPLLGGDPSLPNPEDLLLSSLSACHMLWYLHLACRAGIVVQGYEDRPVGTGEVHPDGSGQFVLVTLNPVISLLPGTSERAADSLHGEIHKYCFIARSVNIPVRCCAQYRIGLPSPSPPSE